VYEPAHDDEITGITRYLDQQLSALRASALGLTDGQARSRPCRSVLSIGGLIKHVTHGMRGGVRRLRDRDSSFALDEAAFAAYEGSFALTDDETVADALTAFDEARAEYLAAVAATDPDDELIEPPQPWNGIFEPRPAAARFYLVHQIEEMARHAGHADIVREELDGMAVPALVFTVEGQPANDFFTPYVPAPGTIGAA